MPRTQAAIIENNFTKGLLTEYTGLNYPENSAQDTDNCIFSRIGRVTRRKGFDLEDTGTYTTLNRRGSVINNYLWKNVSGDGTITLLVVQVGDTLRFYEASDTSTALSGQILSSSITLSTFLPSGSTAAPAIEECQYAQGNGFLFVFHPHLNPFYVSYNATTQVVTGTVIDVKIRDLAGISEGTPDTQRPTTLTDSHRYNLGNQGWRSGFRLTSSTSITIGTGAKTFTTNLNSSVTPIVNGDYIRVYSTANHANTMYGVVTSFTATTLVLNVIATGGAGTLTDWNIVTHPDDILTWGDGISNFPSNADVWWNFKNASDVFAPTSTINNVSQATTAAPKGHYVVSAFNIDRSLVSGISGLTSVSTSGVRPSTGAFFQGRVFYAGVNYSTYNSNIYFSQIIEREEQFGRCYQSSDLTSEAIFDILPSDGGVISIQGAGTIVKVIALRNVLLVFATNGIWAVSGSQGIGFAANDFTVAPVSIIHSLTATSFVQVLDTVTWWNTEGIYTLSTAEGGLNIQSMTNQTIASFYEDIPLTAKQNARGYYNPVTFIIQWIYKSTEASSIETRYEFDRVLNYNTITSAFYPWTIGSSTIKVNGIIVAESPAGNVQVSNVVRSADNVVDASTNQVITVAFVDNILPVFKYLISKPNGPSYSVSFGEEYRDEYFDWVSATGVTYDSYFITGFAVHGDAQRYFESNYIYIYSDADTVDLTTTAYGIQGRWNFATSGNSGKFTSIQRTEINHDNFSAVKRRFKIRGRGLALQLKLTSSEGLPFSVIGWSKRETANAGI